MDEVYAWDQPHIYFYVFGRDYCDHCKVTFFQTSLGKGWTRFVNHREWGWDDLGTLETCGPEVCDPLRVVGRFVNQGNVLEAVDPRFVIHREWG